MAVLRQNALVLVTLPVALLGVARPAAADSWWIPDEVSGFLAAHILSSDVALGDTGGPVSIANAVALGPRLTFHTAVIAIEGELPLAFAGGRDTDLNVAVTLLLPRVHGRIGLYQRSMVNLFAVAGIGVPISLSDNRQVIASDVSVHGYLGAGILFTNEPNWNLRLDTRLFLGPTRTGAPVATEFEAAVSLYRHLGSNRRTATKPIVEVVTDTDGDGLPDRDDRCPLREEDIDGFEDDDGCPDIDDDLDLVLDIADKCPREAEDHNGFEDDDGCPDTVPQQVHGLVGTLGNARFDSGSAALTSRFRRRLRRAAKTLKKYPSVRIVVIGYTDSQEAPENSSELSLQRARAVRDYLAEQGVEGWRVKAAGAGAEDPIGNNDSRRGRSKNRRVEISLRTYKQPLDQGVTP